MVITGGAIMSTTAKKPVVVGVADKQPALLEYAREEAERAGCGVRLVHSYSVPPSAMGSLYGIDVPEMFRATGQEILAEAVGHLATSAGSVRVDGLLVRGFAPAVLESQSRSACLVVIGPDESKPWYIRLFEGRVAHHLVEHAACPVVVVPDSWQASSSHGPVVVMVHGVARAQGPLAFAFEVASSRQAELQVLHVSRDDRPDSEWETVRRVVDAWYDRHPQVSGRTRVVTDDVRDAAVRAANDASLLVLGAPHLPRAVNMVMDSVAQEVIAQAGCAVAVIPAGYRG
jgi:nucleotide-binding universal stress UspA family protein